MNAGSAAGRATSKGHGSLGSTRHELVHTVVRGAVTPDLGCLKDLKVHALTTHLEELSKVGQLCWGVDQIDKTHEIETEAMALQIEQNANESGDILWQT